jgi:hypothetical protein
MGWYYKPPQSFPATFVLSLRNAAAAPDTSIILASTSDIVEAKSIAEKFRYFRWCIRSEPTASSDLSEILDTFDVRTIIKHDAVGYILYLTARPTKLSEFIRLNPDLAAQILPKCQ